MRTIREIKDLPISQLTDEEIVKAARHRLGSDFAMLVYMDEDKGMSFLSNWKNNKGKAIYKKLSSCWNEKFGILGKKNKEEE